MTLYDIRVTDKSPKNVIRQMLLQGIGPRDPEGRDANLSEWVFGARQSFKSYCKAQDWTLGQVLSYLEYQACYIFGGGIEEPTFTQEWCVFQPIVRDQKLLERDWTAQVHGRPETGTAGMSSLEI